MNNKSDFKKSGRDFSGGPVVKTSHFQPKGAQVGNPWLGNEDPACHGEAKRRGKSGNFTLEIWRKGKKGGNFRSIVRMGEGRKYRSHCGLPHNALHLLISADHPWHNEGSGRVPAISVPKSFPPYATHWMRPFRSVCSVTPSTRGLSACPNAHS